MPVDNTADFTHKELCLLLATVCENELGVYIAKNMKDLRKKVNLFEHSDDIHIRRLHNKQGKTRVSVFRTRFDQGLGTDAYAGVAYTTTI